MRQFIFSILIGTCMMATAQQKRIYFYADFVKTKIQYKDGTRYQVMGNYDVANKKMMYLQGNQLMEAINPEIIDTICMGNSTWIYHNKQFCEVFKCESGIDVLVGWHIAKRHEGYAGVYGTAQVPSKKIELTDNLGMGELSVSGGGVYYEATGTNQGMGNGLNVDVWKIKNQSTYYFTKNGKEYALKGLKSIYKAFPEHKEQIKQFVKTNKLEMTNAENALKIVDYILTL